MSQIASFPYGVCVCVCVYTYVYTYVYTHIHKHIYHLSIYIFSDFEKYTCRWIKLCTMLYIYSCLQIVAGVLWQCLLWLLTISQFWKFSVGEFLVVIIWVLCFSDPCAHPAFQHIPKDWMVEWVRGWKIAKL